MRRVQEGAVNIMRRAITIAVIAFAACSLKRASAEDQSLLKQCWTPQVLAGTNQELKSSRTPFHLDFPALKTGASSPSDTRAARAAWLDQGRRASSRRQAHRADVRSLRNQQRHRGL